MDMLGHSAFDLGEALSHERAQLSIDLDIGPGQVDTHRESFFVMELFQMYHRRALSNRAISHSAYAASFGSEQRLCAELKRRACSAHVVDQDCLKRRLAGRPHLQAAAAQAIAAAQASLPSGDRSFAPKRPLARQHYDPRQRHRQQLGVVEASLAKTDWAGGDGNEGGAGWEGAWRQRVN
ncbi:MAG: hypothetical protein WCJ50_04970 [Actinomycetes bacterium]